MTFVQPGARIAVTGATGFVGQVLVEHLATAGYEVVGISESREMPPALGEWVSDYYAADLVHKWPDIGPVDGVVHLAGLAAVGPSFQRPQDYINSNSAMVTRLFEHAVKSDWRGRGIIVSSGAVYAKARDNRSLTEESPLLATSPYVVSKLLVERQTEYYRERGIDALVVRPFNHIGPGQRAGFIVPDLAAKVRERQPDATLIVGNLGSARDYTDVRDIVTAYTGLLEKPEPSHTTYNVCSGTLHTGWEVLESICIALGTQVPPTEMIGSRAIDPSVITGNAERLKLDTGWEPTIPFNTSIEDALFYGD